MAGRTAFTPTTTARLLEAIRAGRSLEQVCGEVGITQDTFQRWVRRGRAESSGGYRDFANAVDQARGLRDEERLSEDDLVRLLERSARKGSVQAIKLLLERPWERKEMAVEKPKRSVIDELASRRTNRVA